VISLPPMLNKKYLRRFSEMISYGEGIEKEIKISPGKIKQGFVKRNIYREKDKQVIDKAAFFQWKVNCVSLISQIIPSHHIHHKSVEVFRDLMPVVDHLRWGLSTLKALKEDFRRGFLGDLLLQVESELVADYMGQAENLLKEGQLGKFDHVPAAVLCGALLEKALRDFCDKQEPPISKTKQNGDPKSLNPLIDDLKKAGVFNEAKAKQLRAWTDIRNHAAHGEFDQFTRKDVEQMIKGVKNFLEDYLK